MGPFGARVMLVIAQQSLNARGVVTGHVAHDVHQAMGLEIARLVLVLGIGLLLSSTELDLFILPANIGSIRKQCSKSMSFSIPLLFFPSRYFLSSRRKPAALGRCSFSSILKLI